jgi:hypothetical protein
MESANGRLGIKAVKTWHSRGNRVSEVQRHAAPPCPHHEHLACKFRAIVHDQGLGPAPVRICHSPVH